MSRAVNEHAKNTITLHQAGALSLIQDAGRFGAAHIGLTQGGALDPFSFVVANRLLSNADNSAGIEITMGKCQFSFSQTTSIAITGAVAVVEIDGEQAPMWSTLLVEAGQIVSIQRPQRGLRNYLAVAGGLQVEVYLNSVATVVREGVGGISGKALQDGMQIPCGSAIPPRKMLPFAYRPKFVNHIQLRLILGYQYRDFTPQQKRDFLSQVYQVSPLCDRMGYRLTSNHSISYQANQFAGLLSEGITLGALQIPPNGEPIVMLNDHQTIGGYPKLGSVLSLDLMQLGQSAPGTQVSFRLISVSKSRQVLHDYQSKIRSLPLMPSS